MVTHTILTDSAQELVLCNKIPVSPICCIFTKIVLGNFFSQQKLSKTGTSRCCFISKYCKRCSLRLGNTVVMTTNILDSVHFRSETSYMPSERQRCPLFASVAEEIPWVECGLFAFLIYSPFPPDNKVLSSNFGCFFIAIIIIFSSV